MVHASGKKKKIDIHFWTTAASPSRRQKGQEKQVLKARAANIVTDGQLLFFSPRLSGVDVYSSSYPS